MRGDRGSCSPARQAIRRLKRDQPYARIVVTGLCGADGGGYFWRCLEVDRVIGNEEKFDAASWTTSGKVAVSDIMAVKKMRPHVIESIEGRTVPSCRSRTAAIIVARLHYSFGRGNSRSLPIEDVVAQARRLVANGYREIVLTGVDITSYGQDLAGLPRIGTLVQRILRDVPELPRLRLSSIDLVEADPALLDALAVDEPRLMPHLHLSLQAGDDLILRRMKRRHSRSDAIAFANTCGACARTLCSGRILSRDSDGK